MEKCVQEDFIFDYSSIERDINDIMDIKKIDKRQIAGFLLKNVWVCQRPDLRNNNYIYYKHMKSNRKNVMYQIILSGDEFDGIYEIGLKGYKIKARYIKDGIGNRELEIQSSGNYEIAMFKGYPPKGYKTEYFYDETFGYSIQRVNFETKEDFKNALIDTGLITEKEYDMYTNDNNKNYAQDKEKVFFVC